MINSKSASVIVLPIEGHNMLKMVWGKNIAPADVSAAFGEIMSVLDKATQPIDVIVDIQQSPVFPLQTTISKTLLGPFNHPQMGRWLVLGSNQMAKIIGNVLTHVGKRDTILWFADEGSMWEYLAK